MKSLVHLFLVLILILSMAACTDKSLNPIFYTLETERSLVEDRGLEDEMTIHEIVKVGTRYFAAGNTLYTRTETGNWTSVSPPVSGALCNTVEIFGGDLYAGFFTTGGTGLGVYRTDPASISWDNAAIDPEVKNIQIGLIKAVGGNLYVATAEQNGAVYDYYLYESPDGTSYTGNAISFDGLSPINLPITDVENDTTDFWVIAGPYLYRQSGALTATIQNAVSDPVGGGGKPLGGLLYSTSLTQLYVSGKDGKLWMWDTATWSSESVTDAPRFTKFVDLDPVVGINDDIFVSTEGTGYYELTGGVLTSPQRRPEYNISALYNGAINCFFLDTSVTPDALFAGTMNAGLWRADYIGGEWLWVQE